MFSAEWRCQRLVGVSLRKERGGKGGENSGGKMLYGFSAKLLAQTQGRVGVQEVASPLGTLMRGCVAEESVNNTLFVLEKMSFSALSVYQTWRQASLNAENDARKSL